MVGIIATNLVGCGDSRKEDRDYVDNNDKKGWYGYFKNIETEGRVLYG